MVWACIEKRRRIRRQDSDDDGGDGENKERKTKARWLDSIRNDLSERELAGEDSQDRAKWRRLIRPHKHKRGKGCGRGRLICDGIQTECPTKLSWIKQRHHHNPLRKTSRYF